MQWIVSNKFESRESTLSPIFLPQNRSHGRTRLIGYVCSHRIPFSTHDARTFLIWWFCLFRRPKFCAICEKTSTFVISMQDGAAGDFLGLKSPVNIFRTVTQHTPTPGAEIASFIFCVSGCRECSRGGRTYSDGVGRAHEADLPRPRRQPAER